MVATSSHAGNITVQAAIVVAVILAVVIVVFGAANQTFRNTLFNPKPVFPSPPKTLIPRPACKDIMLPMYMMEKPEFSTKRVKEKKGEIHCRIYKDFPNSRTVLFCHGNTGVVSDHAYMVDLTRLLSLNLVMFDYRGFGSSVGPLSEHGILEDADLVYRYIIDNVASANQLLVWGMSLGGAPASFLASQYAFSGLLLQSTFSSLRDIAIYSQIPDYLRAAATSYIGGTRRDLCNKVWIAQTKSPVVILHSESDTKIPAENARILARECTNLKKLVWISGDHATPQLSDAQIEDLSLYLTGGRKLSKAGAREFEHILSYHEKKMAEVAK